MDNFSGTPEHVFEWGAGDELQVHMEVCKHEGSRQAVGGEEHYNPRPLIQ